MDDVSTSPEVATESTTPEVSVEAASTATEGESASAPEEVQTTTAEAQGDSAQDTGGEPQPEETPQISIDDFDPSAWEGNIDLLPENIREPVRYLHKHLESGYTKKFQSLSDDRKAFEADRDTWTKEKDDWELSKSELEAERDLLKRILGGSEDPRIEELSTANKELTASIEKIQSEFSAYKDVVAADIEAQAKEYADDFARRHAEIFEDDAKREEFGKLIDGDWDPDLAVKLLDAGEKVVEMATKLKESGTDQALAIEHAMLKVTEPSGRKDPRPGAKLTAGAESKNNPASTRAFNNPANPREALSSAARAAVNWRRDQDLRK